MSARPYTAESMREAVWAITDRITWGVEHEPVPEDGAFVAHIADGVVLVAAEGARGDALRELLVEWEARPETLPRPAQKAVLS